MEETILGLDLGTTSVGWALVRRKSGRIRPGTSEETASGTGKILGMGVRIFPEALETPSLEPRNKKRRLARLARRQTRRRRQRRKHLTEMLFSAGMLPAYGSGEWTKLMSETNPYVLRARSLEARLEPFELGRALYHLEKRRGFRKRSYAEEDEDASRRKKSADDEDLGKVIEGIKTLEEEMDGRTLGQHLARRVNKSGDKSPDHKRIRGRWLGRDMVEDEFYRLIKKQREYHATLKNDEFVAKLHDLVFFQRPTFWRESTLGICNLEPAAPLALQADWEAQQSIVLQTINALRLWGGNQRPLTDEEREVVLALAMKQRKVTFGKIRRELKSMWKASGIDTRTKFTHERDKRKDIPGNATEAALREIFDDAWNDLPARDRIRSEIARRLWEADYRAIGQHPNQRIVIRTQNEQDTERHALIKVFKIDYDLTQEQAKKLATTPLHLPRGWAGHARTAFEQLRPHLEMGLTYTEARQQAYPEADKRTGGEDQIPSFPKSLLHIRNPSVTRSLNELRKVVNNIIRIHGKPDLIRVELMRDLKLPPKKRFEVSKEIRKNENLRKKAKEDLESNKISNPSRADIEKYLLWKESEEMCPYTGRTIGFDTLFNESPVNEKPVEVEHIVPRSRSNDNRMANKTICDIDFNRRKGNRTPYECMNGTVEWDEFVARVKSLKNMPDSKKNRLMFNNSGPLRAGDKSMVNDQGIWTKDGAERALRDSSFIAREARNFLLKLYPKIAYRADPVEPVSSRVTVELRHRWGLDNLVGKATPDGTKPRDDHRHHAVDALVVALADIRFTQMLSRWFAFDRQGNRPEFQIPWPTLRADAKAKLEQIIVSHRVRRKISGPLHEETVFGDTQEDKLGAGGRMLRRYVTRKSVADLNPKKLDEVRDRKIREILKQHLKDFGGDKKKAFGDSSTPPVLSTPSGTRPIRRVRVIKEQQAELMVRLNVRTRAYAKTGENHHMAIYRAPNGDAVFEVVSKKEAMRRQRAKEPIVRREHPSGALFVMSLCLGDTVVFPCDNGDIDYNIVRSLWSDGQIVFAGHREARKKQKEQKDKVEWTCVPNTLLKIKAYKISVDPIGYVRSVKD